MPGDGKLPSDEKRLGVCGTVPRPLTQYDWKQCSILGAVHLLLCRHKGGFFLTYNEALDFIWSTPSPSNERISILNRLLEELNPQGMKYVHVGGTNGKGSTCAMLSSILRCAGYKTGLFTSPHLNTINERFRINGELISDDEFAEITKLVAEACERMTSRGYPRPTIFGLITAVGYIYFKRHKCDIVVLEVGMGGRLDATNVIDSSEVSVIASVGLDHTEYLGSTLRQIAAEKAGIIKRDGHVVCYSQTREVERVIEEECKKQNASLLFADGDKAVIKSTGVHGSVFDFDRYRDLEISMPGLFQVKNAVTALVAAEVLADKSWNIDQACIRQGLKSARWPGRFEIVGENPTVIVDGTHNPQGAAALMESLKALFGDKKIIFITGFLADKDYGGSIELAVPLAKSFYTVAPSSGRAVDAQRLKNEIALHNSTAPIKAYPDIPSALRAAMRDVREDDVICIFGTLYQVSEVHSFFREEFISLRL